MAMDSNTANDAAAARHPELADPVESTAQEMADRILERWDVDLDELYPGASEDDAIGGAIWARTIALLQPQTEEV